MSYDPSGGLTGGMRRVSDVLSQLQLSELRLLRQSSLEWVFGLTGGLGQVAGGVSWRYWGWQLLPAVFGCLVAVIVVETKGRGLSYSSELVALLQGLL